MPGLTVPTNNTPFFQMIILKLSRALISNQLEKDEFQSKLCKGVEKDAFENVENLNKLIRLQEIECLNNQKEENKVSNFKQSMALSILIHSYQFFAFVKNCLCKKI